MESFNCGIESASLKQPINAIQQRYDWLLNSVDWLLQ